MPLTSPVELRKPRLKNGRLYVVATPIGHPDDITIRALEILRKVDLIAAEDTRHSRRLLERHGIKQRLVSYHEHNELERTPQLIWQLLSGQTVALMSNAGTPLISDPGYRLVKAACENEIPVVPIPGVSALTTALSVCGLPTDSFVFAGFLNRKKGKRLAALKQLSVESRTIIFYESPLRILKLLDEIRETMGDRHAVLGREMTKRYEEFIRGPVSDIAKSLQDRPAIKGEFTLIVSAPKTNQPVDMKRLETEIKAKLAKGDSPPSDLSRRIAREYDLTKNEVYQLIIRIKDNDQA